MSFPGDDSTYEIQQRDLRRIMTTPDNAIHKAKCDVWASVFQIVSDNPQMATREFIRMLEAARDEDDAGPR